MLFRSHGFPGDTTLSVIVQIAGQKAIALIDTGSTNTIIDSEFIKQTALKPQQTQANKVLVAGGGELISQGCIPGCQFKIQNTKFHQDCKLLPLKGYDMVLGANWLKPTVPTTTIGSRGESPSQLQGNGVHSWTGQFLWTRHQYLQNLAQNSFALEPMHISFEWKTLTSSILIRLRRIYNF